MSERLIVEVGPWGDGWALWVGGARVIEHGVKATLESTARQCCLYSWYCHAIASELRVKNKQGRYTKRGSTYGRDPERSKG